MSNFSASIAVAEMQAANLLLESSGHGPNNFSVPAYAGTIASVGLLHAWGDPAFEAAVTAIPNVTIVQGLDPKATTIAAAASKSTTWGADAKPLTGTVTPGLYVDSGGILWWVIQSYNTATYSDPTTIPALIRRAKIPGEILPWKQPLDQYDSYKLVNPFTSTGDLCTDGGFTWKVTQADGAGNNVWQPGVYGWTKV